MILCYKQIAKRKIDFKKFNVFNKYSKKSIALIRYEYAFLASYTNRAIIS